MEEKNENVFRKEALEGIRSPEQMDDCLKVTNPGVWIILTAAVLIIAGLFVWAGIGRLETTVPAAAVVKSGTARIILTGTGAEIRPGMTARIGARDWNIDTVEKDEFGRPEALARVEMADGKYEAKIILESAAPISFLIR